MDFWGKYFLNRSLGFRSPLGPILDDYFIGSLKCLRSGKFVSIVPEDSLESPIYAMKFCPAPGYQAVLGLASEEGLVTFQVGLTFDIFRNQKSQFNEDQDGFNFSKINWMTYVKVDQLFMTFKT